MQVDRPSIVVDHDLAATVEATLEQLKARADLGVYHRARKLVRVARTVAPGRPDEVSIEPLPVHALREVLSRAATFIDAKDKPIPPPRDLAEVILARDSWPLPAIDGTITTPTLRPDGTVLDTPGYDAATGLFYAPSTEFPKIPEAPTREQAIEAAGRALTSWDWFRYKGQRDRSAVLAALLSIVGRTAIRGPVPMFATRAAAGGTGKSALQNALTTIALGSPAPTRERAWSEAEWTKRILAMARAGTRIVSLDNIDGEFGSEVLEGALTSGRVGGRVLNQSEDATPDLKAIWFINGNNTAFGTSLHRRVVLIDLAEACDDPPWDAVDHATEHRPEIIADALTVLRAYALAGMPRHGEREKRSYVAWDRLVRGAVVWTEHADPCAGMPDEDESNASGRALAALHAAWWERFEDNAQIVADVIQWAEGFADLRQALAVYDVRSNGRDLFPKTLGQGLARIAGQVSTDDGWAYRLVSRLGHNKTQRWALARTRREGGT